jgi:hypothetical protein
MVKVLRPDWQVVDEPLEEWVDHPLCGSQERYNFLGKFYEGGTAEERATNFNRLQASMPANSVLIMISLKKIFQPRAK